MTERKESSKFTLYGDLDGMTVADLRSMLDEFPDDARIYVRSEKVYGYGGWSTDDQDFFVIRWEERG
jgi:hypothetical protein